MAVLVVVDVVVYFRTHNKMVQCLKNSLASIKN